MVGERFIRFIKPVPPRGVPKLHLFLEYLNHKTQDAKARARHITPNGYGSRLLVAIIKLADLETILKFDNTSKLSSHLLFILKDLEKLVDVRAGKHTTTTLFIKSKTPCFELMFPTRRQNPLYEIPFGESYDSPSWSMIKPLRVCDMGATDLKFNIHTDYFHYSNHGPTHALYGLDCMALVAKFVAYYKSLKTVDDIDQCLLDFVHNEIIVPSLVEDTTAIWLRNAFKEQLIVNSPLESRTATIWDNITTDSIGSDFTGAMRDVTRLKDELKNQSLTPQSFLSSLLMTEDRVSFSQYFTDLTKTAAVPNQQPYVWVDGVKNIAWWEFIILVTSLSPTLPDVISFKRDVLRDIRLWIMLKPWQEIHGSIPLKTMVRNRLEGLRDYLEAE